MIKIYRLNEYDFYAGESLEACIEAYMKEAGISREEAVDEYARELTEIEMERYKVKNEDDGTVKTFKEELITNIQEGIKFPCLFASSEA